MGPLIARTVSSGHGRVRAVLARKGANVVFESERSDMLLLTKAAAAAIGELATQPELPESAGLRITSSAVPDEPAWGAALTAGPGPRDEVYDVAQGHLYLDPEAADRLTDKILDAQTVDDGDVVFHVKHQRGTTNPSSA